jgi:hypothetical protein
VREEKVCPGTAAMLSFITDEVITDEGITGVEAGTSDTSASLPQTLLVHLPPLALEAEAEAEVVAEAGGGALNLPPALLTGGGGG